MLLAHLPVGVVEGVATAAVVLLAAGRVSLPIGNAMPGSTVLRHGMPGGGVSTAATRVLLTLSAATVVVLAPLASSAPDALETVAARLGFLQPPAGGFAGLLPDYELPGVGWAPLAVALAGLVGVAAVSATGYLVGRTAACAAKSR